jgi:hypothetical protein
MAWSLSVVTATATTYGNGSRKLVGTPAKINFCSAELVAVEGQNFSVHTLAAIRLCCLVCDDDFIAGLDESNIFEHSAFSCARPATFKIPSAVQVWIRWRGKGKIICQVFLNKVAITISKSTVILFNGINSTTHVGLPPYRNRICVSRLYFRDVRFGNLSLPRYPLAGRPNGPGLDGWIRWDLLLRSLFLSR